MEASPYILRSIREDVIGVLPLWEPLVVVTPETMPLPQYRLIAELESRQGVKTNDPDFNLATVRVLVRGQFRSKCGRSYPFGTSVGRLGCPC